MRKVTRSAARLAGRLSLHAPASDDDWLELIEDDDDEQGATARLPPWRVLVVDDDRDVHQTTALALNRERILGRPVELLHAYSAAEAAAIVKETPDLALILLDVVMESVDAGLRLATSLRAGARNRELRIILRTGQPGRASEAEVLDSGIVDRYMLKTEAHRKMLIEALWDELARSGKGGRMRAYWH